MSSTIYIFKTLSAPNGAFRAFVIVHFKIILHYMRLGKLCTRKPKGDLGTKMAVMQNSKNFRNINL